MNASDIVKAKQSQTLYKAYYHPTVFQSSVFSTLTPISSFINYVSSGIPVTSTSYASCTTTVYDYQCQPRFLTYASRYKVNDGAYSCAGKVTSKLRWKNTQSTTMYSYNTIYSTLNNPSTFVPSTFRVTSSLVMTAPAPLIYPLITLQQGTSFTTCPSCLNPLGGQGACCEQCVA